MPSADPVLDLSLREVRSILFEELENLPPQYRAPLVLCALEGKSREEAARLLGWSRNAVKGKLERGRGLLRVRLRRRGLQLPFGLCAAALACNSASARVSATLAASTVRAALKTAAARGAVAGVASAEVAALVEGASQTMSWSKAKAVTALLLAVSLTATAFGVVWRRAAAANEQAGEPPAAAPLQPRADKPRGQANQPPGTQPKPEAEGTVEARGRVLDPEGKPMAGAKLYLAKSSADEAAPSEQATSGADGLFRFTIPRALLEEGVAEKAPPQVMAVAEGHGCDWVEVGAAGQELTLRLVKDVPISGRILDPDGKPVVGARLKVMGVSVPKGDDLEAYLDAIRKRDGYPFGKSWNRSLPGQPAVLTTGADGRFRLAGAGRERIVHFRLEGPAIAAAGLYAMTRAAEPVKHPRGWPHIYGASFDYVGRASRPIRGVVRDRDTGKPLAGVSVGRSGSWLQAFTDKEGRYELFGETKLPVYLLTAVPADGLHFRRRVELQDTPGFGALTCDIELVRGLTVRGRVTDKQTGKPVAGARVEYHPLGGNSYVDKLVPAPADSWDPRADAVTGADGSYAITVMPGPGVVCVTAPKWDKYMPAASTLKERKDFFKTPWSMTRAMTT
jgi:protocatechuate 3,4-dioxygenase beta subunit